MREGPSPSDFRRGMIRRRLKKVKKVLLVMSGKGGVGKSVVSASIAALLARSGMKVGLLDADIYGPSSALLLSVSRFPLERESGLKPPAGKGVKVMSVDLFAAGKPIPLTGRGASQALAEMMALTDWGALDLLVVDMPPSTGDVMMFLTSLDKKEVAALVVATPDRLSTNVAGRTMQLLRSAGVPVVGVLGNMARKGSTDGEVRGMAAKFRAPLIGFLPYDGSVSKAVEDGSIEGLLGSKFGRALSQATSRLGVSTG